MSSGDGGISWRSRRGLGSCWVRLLPAIAPGHLPAGTGGHPSQFITGERSEAGADPTLRFLEVESVSPYAAPIRGAAQARELLLRGTGAHRSRDSPRGSHSLSLSPKHPGIKGNGGPETM